MSGSASRSTVLPFLVVGAIGFAIEAALLTLLVSQRHWQPLAARMVSFPVAVTICWWLNRNWTFAGRTRQRHSRGRQYAVYFVIQCAGAAINVVVFWAMLHLSPALRAWPIAPLAIGAAVALSFNFLATSRLVFRHQSPPVQNS